MSPILIRFKFLVQEACQQKLSWDTEINEGLAEKWKKLLHDCAKLAPFIIHRNYIHGRKLSDVTEIELHGFSDASGKAYACVIYLRVLFKNGDILTTFVASKSRVAPIKHVSIPRLEVMACLILVRLMTVTLKSLADYVIDRVFCWGDSTDCLFWIVEKNCGADSFKIGCPKLEKGYQMLNGDFVLVKNPRLIYHLEDEKTTRLKPSRG